jgi:uncharacterized protein (DUF2147 family)
MKLLMFISLMVLFTNLNFKGDDITGYWKDSSGELIVKCYKYETKYYARIVWFDNPNPKKLIYSDEGVNKKDWINYVVMRNFSFDGDKWVSGVIHEIKYGKVYDANIEMNNLNEIRVRGYVYVPLLGKDITFTRFIGKLPEQK